jgi:HK97 family phage major capsid protein
MTHLERIRDAVRRALQARDDDPSFIDSDELEAAMASCSTEMNALLDAVAKRGDNNLTASEQRIFNELRDERGKAEMLATEGRNTRRGEVDGRRREYREAQDAALRSAEKYGGTRPTRISHVNEPGIYGRPDGPSFFSDVVNARVDPVAHDRLLRHQQGSDREKRAATSTSFAGLVIPQFLVEDFAPIARASRPFADFINPRGLPADGMVVNIPRANTGTVVASQTGQNVSVTSQDMVNADIVANVNTIAGQQDVSRQALDRGRNTDEEVMGDLAAAYAEELERQLFHGSGAAGQHLGIFSETGVTSVTIIGSQSSPITQMRLVGQALSEIATNRRQPPDVIVMHPRRWAYWAQATDSQNRPLLPPQGGPGQTVNAFGGGNISVNGIVGSLFGLPVISDATISTAITAGSGGTDVIFVTRASDIRLYEESPLPTRVRFEETLAGQLTVKIVAWGYSAYSSGRYPAASKLLTGSGMVAPVFAT